MRLVHHHYAGTCCATAQKSLLFGTPFMRIPLPLLRGPCVFPPEEQFRHRWWGRKLPSLSVVQRFGWIVAKFYVMGISLHEDVLPSYCWWASDGRCDIRQGEGSRPGSHLAAVQFGLQFAQLMVPRRRGASDLSPSSKRDSQHGRTATWDAGAPPLISRRRPTCVVSFTTHGGWTKTAVPHGVWSIA